MPEGEYVTVQEAAALLGVSRTRMWQLARERELREYRHDLDRRARLYLRKDVEEVRKQIEAKRPVA